MPVSSYSRVVVDYSFPPGVAGAYTPNAADALIVASGLTITPQGSPTIDANGGVWASASYSKILSCSGVPAKVTGIRKYQVWGNVPGSVEVPDGGATIRMNSQDDSNDVRVSVRYVSALPGFRLAIEQLIGGVGTTKATADLSVNLRVPTVWVLHAYDQGDALWATAMVWETDSASRVDGASIVYYQLNRPFKSETSFSLISRATPSFAPIRGFRVSDV